MTITDFINQLNTIKAKHGDLTVIATWEGIFRIPVIYIGKPHSYYKNNNNNPIVLIDADNESYRKELELV